MTFLSFENIYSNTNSIDHSDIRSLINQGAYSNAFHIITTMTNEFNINYYKAEIYNKKNNIGKAIHYYETALALKPGKNKKKALYWSLVFLNRKNNNISGTIQYLKNISILDSYRNIDKYYCSLINELLFPDSRAFENEFNQALSFFSRNKFTEAEDIFTRIAYNHNYPGAKLFLAKIYFIKNDLNSSLRVISDLLNKYPFINELIILKIEILLKQKNISQTERLLNANINNPLFSNKEQLILNYLTGVLAYQQKKYSELIKTFTRLLTQISSEHEYFSNKKKGQIYMYLTRSSIFVEDFGKAEVYSKKGRNLYPKNMQFMLLEIYSRGKNKKSISGKTISGFGKEIKNTERTDWLRNEP
ncbi:MAG: hypothetical protein KAS39_08980, partial [Actinomycetia bacterium]|nr:hypothetical protein [Actinomycetes bacterium]